MENYEVVSTMEEETFKVEKNEGKSDLQGNSQRYVNSNFYDNNTLFYNNSSIHEDKKMQTLPNLDSFGFEFQNKYMVRV